MKLCLIKLRISTKHSYVKKHDYPSAIARRHDEAIARSLIDRFRKQSKSTNIQEELAQACGCSKDAITTKIHNIEHHSTHAAHSFFVSPFEQAAILSVDGMGILAARF